MEDNELARREELGLSIERIKKNRALNRNVDMAGLNAYFKVYHLPEVHSPKFPYERVDMSIFSTYTN